MSKPEIRPDELVMLNMVKDGETQEGFPVNAKWDRIDHFADLGCYILKVVGNTGMTAVYLAEAEALRIAEDAELPLIERDFMFQTEYDGYLIAEGNMLTDAMFGGFDEGQDE